MSYRFALIGCGRIAARHAEHIRSQGRLVAVCDVLPERAALFGRQFGAVAYTSFQDLLKKEEIDIVTVCTPNGCHAGQAIQSLRSGRHVLCEKPMSISVRDGLQMIDAASGSGKKLFVVKQNRYNPPVQEARKLLLAGKLGKILSFQINCFWNRTEAYYKDSWRGTKNMDGGILFTQFSHFTDLLYWFLGDIKEVSGFRANYLHRDCIEFEDTGTANIVMHNGAIGNIHYTINSHKQNMEGSFTFFGERGTLKIGGQYLNEIDYFSVENEERPVLESGKPANQYGHYQGSMSNHHIVYQELIKSLDDPDHQFMEAAEALKSIEIIEKIYSASPFVL
ncbi:MAG TPA: Gfo/Idh/MocA family oxidoreductase [Flavitalea sp.]|nr:Gfo/Idh/MocA family oxidoreductase [Flavitalea sp.]